MKELASETDPPLRPPQLLETLADLGILWNGPAGWELGIPSFADYVLDLAVSEQGAA